MQLRMLAHSGAISSTHTCNRPSITRITVGVRSKAASRELSCQVPKPGSCQPRLPTKRCVAGQSMGAMDASRASDAVSSEAGNLKIGVLFVCLGNICRSPTAEAMFRSVVERAGMVSAFDIDSCGTGGGNPDWFTEGGWSYHEGDPADSRMTLTARKRGVMLTSRSRPLQPLDLSRFDYIVGMDAKNLRAIKTAADYWLVRPMGQGKVPTDYSSRISLMISYCSKFKGEPEVPDPYYGGPAGFERVLDLLEDACEGLLETIRRERSL